MRSNIDLNKYFLARKDWDTTAKVRTCGEAYDLNLSIASFNDDISWHLPSYSGILNHPSLRNISALDKKFIMGTQLLEFVIKTTKFEIEYVNKCTSKLALGEFNLSIPQALKLDALKIYTDEGYHAYFSQKIADQIIDYYSIEDDLTPYTNNFFNQVDGILYDRSSEKHNLAMLACVIVSESMIVNDIAGEMKDIVYEPIKLMFKNHMIDEAFHGKYFLTLFSVIWDQLDDSQRIIFANYICDFVTIFGKPRTDIYFYSLEKLGFEAENIKGMISEIYDTDEWRVDRVKLKMGQILSALDRNQAFRYLAIKEKFSAKFYIS